MKPRESPNPRTRRTKSRPDSEPIAQRDEPKASVMLLGAGELSRELALAFQRLGAEVIAVDRYANAPATASPTVRPSSR